MKICLLSFTIIFSNLCFGQKNTTLHHDPIETLYNKSYLSFSLTNGIIQRAKIVNQSGQYSISSVNSSGIEAGINYNINLKKAVAVITGLHAGAGGRNFQLFISKNDFTPTLSSDVNEGGNITREYDVYFSLPLWLEKRWQMKNHNQWNLLGGINIRYFPGIDVEYISAGYYDANGQAVEPIHITLMTGNSKRPCLNYNIGGGYAVLLHNNNFLKCNLIANLSNTKIVNGTYTIDVTGKPQSSGTYSANLSFIGLSFSYIFTGANARRLKLYEKNMK